MKRKFIFVIGLAVLVVLILGTVVFVLKDRIFIPPSDNLSTRCQQKDAPYLNSKLPIAERVNDLMSRMSDWEKIGQMVLVEKNSIHDIADITRYNLGALLSGGGAGPKQNNSPLAWLEMVNNFQAAAKNTCLGIPLLYGLDAIHGDANVVGATIFPHFIGLGATHDPALVKKVAKATAEEMAATGVYWNFAPNLDVTKDIRWGKTYETFGSDTANVSQLGLAYLQGTQDSTAGYFKALADPKHFIGGGSMEYGTSRNKKFKVEEGNITLDEATLRQVHLPPFQAAVAGGARAIMVSTASWQGKLNSANDYLLTNILKKELGFSGFIVSDWYGVYEISSSRYDSLVTAINAGIDMVMTPFEYKDFMSNMRQALATGDIKKERLDDVVKRILTVKFETGLFDRPQAVPADLTVIGSAEHRELAKEAVRKSQVLLKNKNSALPLSTSLDKIIVAGSAADNLGRQAGGWTTEWQGIEGNNVLSGTTILQAIKNTVAKNTEVEYNESGNFSLGNNLADVGIAVVGEKPYAEGWGDNAKPALSLEDLATIRKVKAQSKKIVVIIISGRPLNIAAYTKDWDGLIAAWLPGSEGQGVADVLFGLYPFTGTLPVSWNY